MEILRDIPVDIDVSAVLAKAHIKPDSQDGRHVAELIESFRPRINPKAMYQTCYIDARDDDGVELGGVRFTSRILRINLENTERAFPFIVTAGTEIEDISQQHTDLLLSYSFDLLKEAVLRVAIAHLHTHLKQRYALEKIAVMNPGSLGDWPITEQRALFSLFGDVKALIGVELTESCLMYPVKSVSGIIFPTETSYVNCQLCPRHDCPSRKAPYDEALLKSKYQDQAAVDTAT